MPSTSKDATIAYYKDITIGFISNNTYIDMDANRIKYIVIENMYEARIMPVIYLSISLEAAMYSAVVNQKKTAKIYLRIRKHNAYASGNLARDDINGQFTYFVSSVMPTYNDDLNSSNSNDDSNYRTLTIGLLDMTIMNSMRKSFYGIYKDIDQHTLIYNTLKDTKVVMKTPKYNKHYDTFIVPPMSSRNDMLKYIFNEDAFYDTEFLYYMDFDKSYLLDRTGEAINAGDGSYDNVVINARSVTVDEAYRDGMEVRNNGYYFSILPGDIAIRADYGTEKIANQLVGVADDGYVSVDLNINNFADSTVKQRFQRLDTGKQNYALVYKNAMESSGVVLEVVKANLDSSIITPNKIYLLNNYSERDEYNGRYMLLYKKEILTGNSGVFISSLVFGMKKLNDVQEIDTAMNNPEITTKKSKTRRTTAIGNTYSTRTTSVNPSKRGTSTSESESNN